MDADSLSQIEQIVSGAEGRLRNEVQGLQQEFGEKTDVLATAFRQEFDEKLDKKFQEAERHSGALFEEVLHRIDLVVEGHQALHQRIDKLEAGMEHEFLETRSFMQLSYRQLQERVETLEQRVQLIEKRLGFAN